MPGSPSLIGDATVVGCELSYPEHALAGPCLCRRDGGLQRDLQSCMESWGIYRNSGWSSQPEDDDSMQRGCMGTVILEQVKCRSGVWEGECPMEPGPH